MVRFVASALGVFTDDVAAHALSGGCGRPTRGVLPVSADDESEQRLAVDWSRCDGHGLCAKLAPKLISLDGNGYPVFPDSPVPGYLQAGARRAVRGCPALALRLARRGAGAKH
jgi:ferredoxin